MAKVSFADYRRRAYILNFGCGVIFLLTIATTYSPLYADSDEEDYLQQSLIGIAVASVGYFAFPVSAIYCSIRARRDRVLLIVGCLGIVMLIVWFTTPIAIPFNWTDEWRQVARLTSVAYTVAALISIFGYKLTSTSVAEDKSAY